VTALFDPLVLRGVTARNRVWVSPMCQYTVDRRDGVPTDWHLVHLGSFARGGAGIVLAEATAVTPEGRISAHDTGIWSDEQVAAWRRITDFAHTQGALVGLQLAHAGRKASVWPEWGFAPKRGTMPVADGGWQTVSASDLPFDGYAAPRALGLDELPGIVEAFRAGARRALDAGFDLVEVHAAHGYLLHQFLSPLSNLRGDEYGGDFEGRARLPLRVAAAVRAAFPERLPVFARLSVTDWVAGGWDLPQSIRLARALGALGIDFIDCSSGGVVPGATIPVGPGYQVAFSQAIRREAGVPTGAVGLITSPEQAETIVATGQADAVLLARELLRDPYWPLRAAQALGAKVSWPVQYDRARRG
jgi:2,4-dienoyl-CoA reductase-like NADH-dependent reductase (Old Yellow Enzyme family)